jgi:hypothetical protein
MLVAQNHWVKQLLSGSRALCCGFLAIALVESINASRGVDQLLLAREKRMTSRADFDVQVAFFGRTSLECLAASAANGDFYVFRMNSWFHLLLVSIEGLKTPFRTSYDRGGHAKPSSR